MRRDARHVFVLLGCYSALIGRHLPTFRHSLWVPSSQCLALKDGPIDCPETSVNNYQSALRNIPEEWRPHTSAGAWNHYAGGIKMRVSWVVPRARCVCSDDMEESGASLFRDTKFGSGRYWSDWQEEMCQMYRKAASIVANQRALLHNQRIPLQVTPACTWSNFGYPADEGSIFFRNVGINVLSYTIYP